MDDYFEIPVLYKGNELLFKAQLITFGYVHKFKVEVEDREVFYEQDENGEYRALVDPFIGREVRHTTDLALLKEIAAAIESILK